MTDGAPRNLPEAIQKAEEILDILLNCRREVPDETPRSAPRALAASTQFTRILDFVIRNQPVRMALPGFPCKSPSTAKVIGTLPDEAERLALIELDEMCCQIGDAYAPGATLTICSDGHVFADHIGVDDDTITAYNFELRAMITSHRLHQLEVFDLQSMWPGRAFSDMRALFDAGWCESPETVQLQARTDEDAARLVRGMTRFLVEDSPETLTQSRAQRQRDAKRRAYHVISRSRGWGRVVAAHFPRHLRLSIHPQSWGSEKLGVRLLEASDGWTTPWHSTVLYRGDKPAQLVHHKDARACGTPQTRNGRISHYVSR